MIKIHSTREELSQTGIQTCQS